MNADQASSGSPPSAAQHGVLPDGDADIRSRYRALRSHAAPGELITLLHMGAGHTAVATGRDADPAATLVLAMGTEKTAGFFFQRSPPTPLELETAIASVEDQLARVLTVLPVGSRLYCQDAMVREIALLSGVAPGAQMILALEAMEQTFERLAAVAEGRPVLREGLPDSTAFAAALLILREFMHHLRFAAITWVD